MYSPKRFPLAGEIFSVFIFYLRFIICHISRRWTVLATNTISNYKTNSNYTIDAFMFYIWEIKALNKHSINVPLAPDPQLPLQFFSCSSCLTVIRCLSSADPPSAHFFFFFGIGLLVFWFFCVNDIKFGALVTFLFLLLLCLIKHLFKHPIIVYYVLCLYWKYKLQ